MPQTRLQMTTTQAEKLFYLSIVDAPPPLQAETVEAVDQPALAAVGEPPPFAASMPEAAIAQRKKSSGKPRVAAPVPLPVTTPPTETRH